LTGSDPNATLPICQERSRSNCLSRLWKKARPIDLSRRKFLQYCQAAPLVFLPAGLHFPACLPFVADENSASPLTLQLHPEYRVKRGMDSILRKVPAGLDEFVTEKYQDEVEALLREWSSRLLQSTQDVAALRKVLTENFLGTSFKAGAESAVRQSVGIRTWKVDYVAAPNLGGDAFLSELRSALSTFSKLIIAEFQTVSIRTERDPALAPGLLLTTVLRFQLAGEGSRFYREQRVGHWELLWERLSTGELRLHKWRVVNEERSRASVPIFQDITAHAFGGNACYAAQMLPGTDNWRTVLDGASGIDIYGHNGVSVADVDGDGLDDVYICQPAGLPNRLFRNRGDGTFEDITDSAGVGVLEYSACALFADINNDGRQDLIVVRSNGPLLFLNQGGGKFRLKRDAFQFAQPPQGTFTGAAMEDYDRDGWLDIYFCLYSYYQGADQYRYPMPYFDAENGPPNFLMRNHHDETFHDVTKQTGMSHNNTRFSFACTWGDYNGDNWPDLYVVNDFGRKNLYRNNGDGTFTDVAREMGVEDIGAGMSGAWLDFDNDGRPDIYVANMWTAAGMRVSEQDIFQKEADPEVRELYHQHSMGNYLYQNKGQHFDDVTMRSGAGMGRWAWSSDAWDFNHDGFADIYIANGMVTGKTREDLNSFFWRQVVANSPNDPKPSHQYEQAWNAINDLIRSDWTWSGFERNVLFLNNQDGTFSDISGISGLDFIEDSRTFALGDFDLDGRLEAVLKNRNSPQMRYLKNVLPDLPPGISFRLTGKKSNRDAIGAKVTVDTKLGRQTRTVRCGTGFLAQHSKELFFGLGNANSTVQVTIEWPSGLTQKLQDVPVQHRIWVEEGSPPSRVEPYVRRTDLPASAVSPEPIPLPQQAETWLLVPVLAPEFSLADNGGRTQSLSSLRSKPVLVHFWSAKTLNAGQNLKQFQSAYGGWQQKGLHLLVISVDERQNEDTAKAVSSAQDYSFPMLAASADVIATYNLLFGQLFDRHRNMSVPISFLIDAAGNIVKVYQGPISAEKVEMDFKAIPATDSQRLARALPFAGFRETYEFERNYLSLGFVFYERGYFQQAEQFYAQAVKDDPSSAEALYGLGSAYLQQQKAAQAKDCFERALKLQATYPGTISNCWNNLGTLAAREGSYDQAIDYFQTALKIDPRHSIALQNLGSAYRQKRDWPDAKATLERALALNPDDPDANYSLGMVYAQQNDPERAYEYLQRAITARPAYPEALNNLGILYLRTKRPNEAIQSFEESIRVAPAYDQAYLNLARVYAIEGDREKAKEILRELLKHYPDHPQAQEGLKQLDQ
jgi:tetratricopeptide (TPR) repeat protein/peroxiredoxin